MPYALYAGNSAAGAKGDPGEAEKSAYQLWLEAGSTGTISDYLNSLKGANGEPGTGQKGETGEAGKSAYQVWLEAGNTGTISEYLSSLKGEQGIKGDPGSTGPQGANGTAGEKGERGEAGQKGDQGQAGAMGPQGPIGATGAKGDKGERGEVGPIGITDIIETGGANLCYLSPGYNCFQFNNSANRGTIGVIVTKNNRSYLLSNMHVLGFSFLAHKWEVLIDTSEL